MPDMYNFDNNNYNNENHDGFNHYEFDENNSNTPNHKKTNAKMVKFAKKVGAIALSAVLFGGVAAGSYQGVNALSELPHRQRHRQRHQQRAVF